MSISKKFFAWLISTRPFRDDELVHREKRELFKNIRGTVLEIGAGTGINLQYFPKDINYTALEPNSEMYKYLEPEFKKQQLLQAKIINSAAEIIPLDDSSTDFVVSTLVFCSVTNLSEVLKEIHRVLKPGGQFLFMEHVAAPQGTFLRKLQHFFKPLWGIIGDGCNPEQETWVAIEQSDFKDVKYKRINIIKRSLVAPHIIGYAMK